MRIVIFLPRRREHSGFLHLFDATGRVLIGNLRCRGKADSARAIKAQNPLRDPARPYGDTPSGLYAPSVMTRYEPAHPTFGKFAILIEGVEGEALRAKENGRVGLAIHGGRGDGDLVATYGCVRLLDKDMLALNLALGDSPVVAEVEDI